MSNLGSMYENGQGVPINYNEAMNRYKMAADQGDAFAMVNLANMQYAGRGVRTDYVRSRPEEQYAKG
jgi:TPR repeat protein